MITTISAMEARQKFGEILNRVDLVHDQFIIERNGRPLAAIVPISSLTNIQGKARSRALAFLDSTGSDITEDEANKIAVEAVKEVRAERRKKKLK
jgi:prevent-host-death family protein